MKQLGWFPVDAKQVKTRKANTKGVGKHLVVFQNDDIVEGTPPHARPHWRPYQGALAAAVYGIAPPPGPVTK